MYCFAIFATLLATSANLLAQVHRGKMKSRTVIGHTSEICEPVYEQHRYREHDDDFRNYHHRNRNKQLDDLYEYTDELSDEVLRELALEKPLSMDTKTGHSKSRTQDHIVDVLDDDKYTNMYWNRKNIDQRGKDHRESVGPVATIDDYNSNSNVNRLGKRKHEKIMKNLFNDIEENNVEMDSGAVSDTEDSVEPTSRILKNISSYADVANNKNIKLSVKERISQDMLSIPGGKYNPPPYFGYRIHKLSDTGSNVNINSNVNNIGDRNADKQSRELVSSQGNHQTDPSDSDVFEKNSPLDTVDVEIMSGNQDDAKTYDSQPIDIVTPYTSSVTGTVEASSTLDNVDNKLKKLLKHRKVRGKAHSKKKKKRIHHKQYHQQPQIPEQQKNHSQQYELSSETNIESTTSIAEAAQGSIQSLQSPDAGNSLITEVKTEKKLDPTHAILKLLFVNIRDQSPSRRVRKLKYLLDKLNNNEKETILHDLEQGKNKSTIKVKLGGEMNSGDESKVILELLTRTSHNIGTFSDSNPTDNETTNTLPSSDETENNVDIGRKKKTHSDVRENVSSGVAINDEAPVKESGLNDEDINENEVSDRHKAAKITSNLHDSKVNGVSEDSSRKEELKSDSASKPRDDNNLGITENDARRDDDDSSGLMKNHEGKRESLNNTVPKLHPADEDHDDSLNERVNHNLSARLGKINSSQNPLILNSDRKDDNNEIAQKILMPPDEGGELKYRRRNQGQYSKETTRRSAVRQLPQHKHSNRNVNTNVNTIRKSPLQTDYEDDDETTLTRRTLDHSILKDIDLNQNSNVNTNSNINRNVANRISAEDGRRRHRHRFELAGRGIGSILDGITDLRDEWRMRNNHDQRRQLHKLRNDLA